MNFLISVIIPAYNCERFIKESIQSIATQTYSNLEILIADDGSTDNTKHVIDSFKDPRIRAFHNQTNVGYLKTCNKLLSLAKGHFIAFQDADDNSDATRFEKQLKAFETTPTLGVCGCGIIRTDLSNNATDEILFPLDINAGLKEKRFDFVAGTFLIKREVYNKIGGYNDFFDRIGFEDFYWSLKASHYFKMINLSEALYKYRNNPQSVSNSLNSSTVSYSYQALLYLLNQRSSGKKDFLESGKHRLLQSEVYLKLGSLNLDQEQYITALKYVYKSLLLDPASLYKMKTFFKFLIKSVKSKPKLMEP
jgi:glycosyltransferase involved in cell wall biosynthesis